MKDSHRFFENRACEYYPCHKGIRTGEFNCLFCFCPLYFIEDCGGAASHTPEGVKDCSACLVPHKAEGYDKIIARLSKEIARRAKAP